MPEVIDCWFDSGAMPFAQWGYPHKPGSEQLFTDRFPADFISEAIDQTRGWFYTLLAISTMLFGERAAGFSLRGDGSGVNAGDPLSTPAEKSAGARGDQSGREAAKAEARGSSELTFAEPYPHPFRNCIVMGIMGGEDGKKLSKSKRNYKDPSYIFDKEGADAMVAGRCFRTSRPGPCAVQGRDHRHRPA